ncbi:MAG: phosphatidate cytidylyltransferase [Thermoanaerobaculia bacterium]
MASFKREITALFGILLVALFLFFLPPVYFHSLVLFIIFLTALEISFLFFSDFLIFKIFLPLFSLNWAYFYFFPEFFIKYLLPLNLIIPLLLILIKKPDSSTRALQLFGAISIPILTGYFGGSLAYLRTLEGEKKGLLYIIYILTLVWISDSLAYYIGKNFGKRKIAPNISPNKTVEGTISLFLGAIIITFIFFNFSAKNLLLGLFMGFASFFGDLFQSYAKRTLNIKDSGSFFPGHGGFWDRTDSLFFSSYIFYLFKTIL